MRGSNKQVWLAAIIGLTLAGMSTTAFAQAPAAPLPVDTSTDHENVVGHFGVGYLGASQVAVGATNSAAVLAPVVGMRYWINDMLGLDLGLGFGATSGETKTSPEGGESVTVDDPSYSAFILHAGVPLSLAQGKHFSFQVVPEMNVGIGSGESELAAEPPATEPTKIDHSGMRLDVGARAGGELHFGFIGVPELSLQGSIGVQYVMAKTESKSDGEKIERTTTRLGTTVGDNPWNIFTTNVAALYYF